MNHQPSSFLFPLFEHLNREHGMILLESELAEIVRVAAPLSKQAEALQAVRDWYDRDGSVGGCDTMMEEHVEPLTIDSRVEPIRGIDLESVHIPA